MSTRMDLYGFTSYERDVVDDRHLLACPGCYTCGEALDRAYDRAYTRRHRDDTAADRAHDRAADTPRSA